MGINPGSTLCFRSCGDWLANMPNMPNMASNRCLAGRPSSNKTCAAFDGLGTQASRMQASRFKSSSLQVSGSATAFSAQLTFPPFSGLYAGHVGGKRPFALVGWKKSRCQCCIAASTLANIAHQLGLCTNRGQKDVNPRFVVKQ